MIDQTCSNSSARTVVIINKFNLINLHNSFKGKVKLNVMENKRFDVIMVATVFSQFHFLFESFNVYLKRLIESGIVFRWTDRFCQKKFDFIEPGPSVLTFEHLRVGFQVWLCFLLISTLVFYIEVQTFHRRHIFEVFSAVKVGIVFKLLMEALGKTSWRAR